MRRRPRVPARYVTLTEIVSKGGIGSAECKKTSNLSFWLRAN